LFRQPGPAQLIRSLYSSSPPNKERRVYRVSDIINRLKVERDAQEIDIITLKTQVDALK
jgi:hypothetical protein